MISFSIDELVKKVGGRYRLVILASQRAQEIAGGFKPLVDPEDRKIPEIALCEMFEGKVKEDKEVAKS